MKPLRKKALANHLPIYNQVGRVLPVIARAVMRACFGPDLHVDDSHYNIVQNNGMFKTLSSTKIIPRFHSIASPSLLICNICFIIQAKTPAKKSRTSTSTSCRADASKTMVHTTSRISRHCPIPIRNPTTPMS